MHNVIAERTLTLLEPDGSARQVFVRLGKPEESLQHDDYHCPVQIIGLGDEEVFQVFGVDAFQALQLALKYISFKLHHYRKESNLVLYCWEKADDMGFPESPSE